MYEWKGTDLEMNACAMAVKYMDSKEDIKNIPGPDKLKLGASQYQDGTNDLSVLTSQKTKEASSII